MRIAFLARVIATIALLGCGTVDDDGAEVTDGGGAGTGASDAGDHRDAAPVERDAGPGGHDAGLLPPACGDDPAEFGSVRVFEMGTGELGAAELGDLRAALSGVVTAQGQGALPADVATEWQVGTDDSRRWIRIAADGGSEWIVAASHLPVGFGVATGAAATATFFHHFGGWDPELVALTLHVGDVLAFHFGRGSEPSALELPSGVVAARSDALCTQDDGCGSFSLYGLEVSLDGVTATLGSDQTAAFGAYDVWHARTASQLPGQTQCADWFVADSTLAIAHRVPLSTANAGDCHVTSSSTLPNVHIELDDSACAFTLAQAMAGLSFDYQVVVDADLGGVTAERQDAGHCQAVHASGLYLGERISGGGESYCVCDTGLCAPGANDPKTLSAGTYPGTFSWDGHNWSGPSDTSNPKGPLFPAGTYTFEVQSTGLVDGNGFAVRAALTFSLQ